MTKTTKKIKTFLLAEYFEDLQSDTSFSTKKMFGCLAIYYRGLNVAMLAESPGDTTYRGKKYDFDIWEGVMLPTEREHHPSLIKQFPNLVPHPVLGKWLYLPQQLENFEETLTEIIGRLRIQDPRFGIIPGQSK